MWRSAWMLVLAACAGNDLRPSGSCDAATSATPPTLDSIPLLSGDFRYDDLRFAPDLGKVIAVPEGSGELYLVDPDTLAVTSIAVPSATASADAKGGIVYGADRGNSRITIVDTIAGAVIGDAPLDSFPDYVRASPTSEEVWVSLPGAGRIDWLTISGAGGATTLTHGGSISIGDPEGLTFDGEGHAFTNDGGHVVEIDVASHAVLDRWGDGCGASHGFPQIDPTRGLAFGGCAANGGASVVSTSSGAQLAGIEAGGGAAILAYDPTLHHLYLRGDGAPTLDVLGVCSNGSLSTLTQVTIPAHGHGATADQRGHVWICDPDHGGIVRVSDPFPPSS
jgi:hypothetical protein